jgi:hypothetical protein
MVVQDNICSKAAIAVGNSIFVRNYDPNSNIFTFVDADLNLKKLHQEIQRISDIARVWIENNNPISKKAKQRNEHIQKVLAEMARGQPRALHVSELFEADLAAIAAAKVPEGFSHLDDEMNEVTGSPDTSSPGSSG